MKKKNELIKKDEEKSSVKILDESALFERIAAIIDNRKSRAGTYVNSEITLMYWEIGNFINSVILGGERGKYGKQILATVSEKLTAKYGKGFEISNIYRMMRFSDTFNDFSIVATLSPQLSWSHIIELLPLKKQEAIMYYATDSAERKYGVRELRHQISRKAYERREIANANLTDNSSVPFNVFKDPYILETLGLKENFLEADLEKAILSELESFILEFGQGLTFIGRQKRFIFEDEDYYPDLLFYHRDIKRLIVIELKLGKFKPEYKGQMEMYLKLLNRYERREDEHAPIGLILCTKASRKQIELLELDKAGIAVSEYWTVLPPKEELERKINEIMAEAQERLERRKSFPMSSTQKKLDFFYEPKDDVDE
jgi:predicted nuclease of restriction endonuclease-like (RecB) superfamily